MKNMFERPFWNAYYLERLEKRLQKKQTAKKMKWCERQEELVFSWTFCLETVSRTWIFQGRTQFSELSLNQPNHPKLPICIFCKQSTCVKCSCLCFKCKRPPPPQKASCQSVQRFPDVGWRHWIGSTLKKKFTQLFFFFLGFSPFLSVYYLCFKKKNKITKIKKFLYLQIQERYFFVFSLFFFNELN